MRKIIWYQINELAENRNIVVAWSINTESGFYFVTYGENCRMSVELDGLRLVKFKPEIK
ncbi:MAG: CRISPR-associated protein Cas2 [Psychromonas sp.]